MPDWFDQFLAPTPMAPASTLLGGLAPTVTGAPPLPAGPPQTFTPLTPSAGSRLVPSTFATVNGQPVGGEETDTDWFAQFLAPGAGSPSAAAADPDPSWLQTAASYFGEALAGLNPKNINRAVQAINPITTTPEGEWTPYATLKSLLATPGELSTKAYNAFERGDYATGVRHAINSLGAATVVGAPTAARLDEAGDLMAAGEYARGLGATTDVALQTMGPAAARNLPGSIRIPAIARNPNPLETAAVEAGQRAGVPVDAATATGNPFVRGAQLMAEHTTLLGGHASQVAAAEQAAGLARWGGALAERAAPGVSRSLEEVGQGVRTGLESLAARDTATRAAAGERLATRVSPTPMTPETAGAATRQALETFQRSQDALADASYGRLRELEADPAYQRTVPIRQRTVEVPGAAAVTVPVREAVAMPVDLRAAKRSLQGPYDRLLRERETMGQLQGPRAQALATLDRIMQADDYAPLSAVDGALSELKRIVRTADSPDLRNMAQGTASNAVRQLESAVQSATAKAGPEVARALKAGRDAVKAKYAAADALKTLSEEPVRAYGQLTRPADLAIEQLREVRRYAPQELPKLGRAYLDDLLAQDPAAAAKKWAALGPETKGLLIQDPALRAAVGTYFSPAAGRPGSAAALLRDLPTEPVKVLTSALAAKDAAIGRLDAIAQLVPEALPQAGRAFLDDLVTQATKGGGFKGAQGLKADWDRLGPRTKALLYPDPAHVKELDHFFTLAAKMNPNPGSRTAMLLGGAFHGARILNPAAWPWALGEELLGQQTVKLLHSAAGVRALTRGLTVPLGRTAGRAAYTPLAGAVGQATTPVPGYGTLAPSHARTTASEDRQP